MKFLLDENVHNGLVSFLRGLGNEVLQPPKGIKNGKVFAFAQKESCILLTRDNDFLNEPFIAMNHEGIIFLRVHPKDLEAQQRALTKLLTFFTEPDKFKNKIIRLLPNEEYELVK